MAAQDKVTFRQDLTEPVKIRHYEGVVFTGDDCGNLIKVALFDGGTPYSGGGTVSATAVLADGTTFPLTQGSITGNMVSVPLEAGALVVSGLMGLYVKISGGGIICTVLNAIFTVQVTDTGRVPAATVTTVNELVAAIRDAQDSIPADLTNLLAAVAPTFSTSTAYSAGAYVWQGGKLYRFTAAHPAGTWTGTDAVTVALGDDVADLKSALNETQLVLNNPELSGIAWTNGKYVNKTTNQITNGGTALNITDFIYLPKSTSKIITNANRSSVAWTVAYYDSAKTFISGESGSVDNDYNTYANIPENAEYIIITHYTGSYGTNSVRIEIFANSRIDNLEEEVLSLQEYQEGINNKIIDIPITWTASKRLDVSGNVINASSSFAISQIIDIENDDFFQIEASGMHNVSDGSTYAIRDANGNVVERASFDGSKIFLKSEMPSGSATIQFCHYISSEYPIGGVSVSKRYSKRIIDIETDVDDIKKTILETNNALSADQSYKNVLQGATTFTDNRIINDAGNSVSNPNFCLIDGFFTVKPNTSYKLYRGEPPLYSNAGHNWTFWDENKNFLSYTLSGSTVTSPTNAAYLRFAVYISSTGSVTHETFDPTNVIITEDAKPCFDDTFTALISRPTFNGLKWIGIGDSITEANFRATYHYWDYVVAETGLNFVNMGVSGTGYKAEGSGDKAFYKRVPSMATDADVITIFGGVNDVVLSNAIIGTEADTGTDTICGCVNTTLDRIETLYPAHMPIGIVSPLPCACVDSSVNLHPVQNPADDSCRMAQFVEQLSLICKHRGIPFLDLFHQSNLRPWHQECNAKYFSCESAKTGDGLHPNGHGHRLIYRQILDFVQKIVMK